MSRKRPYLARFQGKDRVIDAISIADASNHVLKPELDKVRAQLEGVRPATAAQVAEFARAGGEIETAGVYPKPEPDGAERAAQLFVADGATAGAEAAPPGAEGAEAAPPLAKDD